jgi:tRNA/tmRNA/rRNA uracil-C5-methylase (TrmA/RlmC/RlmD family)
MATNPRRRRPRRDNPTERAGGAELELTPTTVAHGGVFVARHEGRVVFVADALPGERVRARVDDTRHDRFWRAETLEVLEPSPHRLPHVWPEAAVERAPEDRAGGAEFGHIALAEQRLLKAQVVEEALRRMAGVERAVTVRAIDGDEELRGAGWRTRVRLHVGRDGRIGPFASRSHRVIPVRDLPLATRAVGDTAPLAETFPGARFVDVVAPSTGEAFALIDDGKGGSRREVPGIVERVGDREFALAGDGFWQVHRGAAATLTRAVQDAIDGDAFEPDAANLDLYGGVGLLAAAVGDRFGDSVRITTVESSAEATAFAGANLAEWAGAEAVSARVEEFVQGLADADRAGRDRARSATVVLDPPRSGAGRDVVAAIAESSPSQIVYVACDPVAFARDAAYLGEAGYGIAQLSAFDLFPNTHHVELVARLVR